jgi:hypothetical protein
MSFLSELRKNFKSLPSVSPEREPVNAKSSIPIRIPSFPHLSGYCSLMCGFGKIERNLDRYQNPGQIIEEVMQSDNIELANKCKLMGRGYMCPVLAWIDTIQRLSAVSTQE